MKLLLNFNEWNHGSNTFEHLTVNFFKTLNIKIFQILTLNIKKVGQTTLNTMDVNTKPHPDPLISHSAQVNRTASGATQRSAVYYWVNQATRERGQIIAFGIVNIELFSYKI